MRASSAMDEAARTAADAYVAAVKANGLDVEAAVALVRVRFSAA